MNERMFSTGGSSRLLHMLKSRCLVAEDQSHSVILHLAFPHHYPLMPFLGFEAKGLKRGVIPIFVQRWVLFMPFLAFLVFVGKGIISTVPEEV